MALLPNPGVVDSCDFVSNTREDGVHWRVIVLLFLGMAGAWLPTGFLQVWGWLCAKNHTELNLLLGLIIFSAQNSQGECSDCIWLGLRHCSEAQGWMEQRGTGFFLHPKKQIQVFLCIDHSFSFPRSTGGTQKNMAMPPTQTSPSATLSPGKTWPICGFLSRAPAQWPVGKVRQQNSVFTFYGDFCFGLNWI